MNNIIKELKEKLNSETWDNEELIFAIRELAAIIEDLATLIKTQEVK